MYAMLRGHWGELRLRVRVNPILCVYICRVVRVDPYIYAVMCGYWSELRIYIAYSVYIYTWRTAWTLGRTPRNAS